LFSGGSYSGAQPQDRPENLLGHAAALAEKAALSDSDERGLEIVR